MADADVRPPTPWTKRPLFAPNQMLTANQLNLLMDDQRTRTEMLMRGLHGHGVIFGFAVEPGAQQPPRFANLGGQDRGTELTISCGMALDRHGRLLHWPGGPLMHDAVVKMPECPGSYTLSVHYAYRAVPAGDCGPCADKPEWIEEGVVFTLHGDCRPADRECPDLGDERCISLEDYVCMRTGSHRGPVPPAPDLDWACARAGTACRIECSDTYYDAAAGIPIACVEVRNLIESPECAPIWGFGEVSESCATRPYVYRTPLLYELIRGCQTELAQVEALSWQDWILAAAGKNGERGGDAGDGRLWPSPVPWNEFAARFRDREALWIRFTKPIDITTVHPGSTFLTAISWEKEADYVLTRRIPTRLEAIDPTDGFAASFRLLINTGWIDNELKSRSNLRDGGRIELTIRGQMLRDRCGNLLNAVPLFYEPKTPVQNRPGDDFIAVFRFATAPPAPRPRQASRTRGSQDDI